MKKTITSMKSSSGFTMVELIIVIAILGVLAATALPRFFDTSTQARKAAVNGIAGGLRSAAATAQAAYFAAGKTTDTKVTMLGNVDVTVTAGSGIPTATGILEALSGGVSGMEDDTASATGADAGKVILGPKGTSSDCRAKYDPSNGTVTVVDTCS